MMLFECLTKEPFSQIIKIKDRVRATNVIAPKQLGKIHALVPNYDHPYSLTILKLYVDVHKIPCQKCSLYIKLN